LLRPKDRPLASALVDALERFSSKRYPLPGIARPQRRDALLEQIFESLHRIEYVQRIRERPISGNRANSSSDLFDPLKAAVLFQIHGDLDEAFWLVFFFVHFGKNARTGWRLARDVYGALGSSPWNWPRASRDPHALRDWLASNQLTLQGRDGVERHFGNHRKYQSLDAGTPTGTGAAFETYIDWVGPTHSHQTRVRNALEETEGDPRRAFDWLYQSMDSVSSFGRTARFDYLTMVGKLGLAQIEPGSTYMQGATGPVSGARLLFGDNQKELTRPELDSRLIELGRAAGLGMQVLEDSLCNWQKSPDRFKPFRG